MSTRSKVAPTDAPDDKKSKLLYSVDPAHRLEWPVGPWPAPWFRGLHSWSVWFASEPDAGPITCVIAPWISVLMALIEVFIMATLVCEELIPACSSYTGHGACGPGMFCSAVPDPTHFFVGECVDCEFFREGTGLDGNALTAAVNASAAVHCADDLPDVCDALPGGRPLTYSAYVTSLVYLFIFPQAIISSMDKAASEFNLLEYRLRKHRAALGLRAAYAHYVSLLAACLRNCVVPPVLTVTVASFLTSKSSLSASLLTVAFIKFASILKIDILLLYLFVHGRQFDDTAFKADLAAARGEAPFSGVSLAFVGRRVYGALTIIFVTIMVYELPNLMPAIVGGRTDCNAIPLTYLYSGMLLVILHGGCSGATKVLLERPAGRSIDGALVALAIAKGIGGAALGAGLYYGGTRLVLTLHSAVTIVGAFDP